MARWMNVKGEFNHLVVDELDGLAETACKQLHRTDELQANQPNQPKCLGCWNRRHGTLNLENKFDKWVK